MKTNTLSLARRVLNNSQYTALQSVYYRLRALGYSGASVYCPCCRGQFRRFIKRSNNDNRCPGCSSLRRHRLMAIYLESKLQYNKNEIAVLHIAPEPAIQCVFSRMSNVSYVSADLARPAMRKMDIAAIPDTDNSYDTIICSHVLEHVPDDKKAMAELCRVLKPGGFAILLVPFPGNLAKTHEDPSAVTPEQRLHAYGQSDHVRIYGMDYFDRLREAGFAVTVEPLTEQMEPSDIERYGLFAGDTLTICQK